MGKTKIPYEFIFMYICFYADVDLPNYCQIEAAQWTKITLCIGQFNWLCDHLHFALISSNALCQHWFKKAYRSRNPNHLEIMPLTLQIVPIESCDSWFLLALYLWLLSNGVIWLHSHKVPYRRKAPRLFTEILFIICKWGKVTVSAF